MKLRAFALITTLALGLLATPVQVEAQKAGEGVPDRLSIPQPPSLQTRPL